MKSFLGLFIGLLASLVLVYLVGEDPLLVLKILTLRPLSTLYDFGQTLTYMSPLIFCGLSVCIAFHAGLFNIGAEGQMTAAVFIASIVGIVAPSGLGPLLSLLLIFTLSCFMGILWGMIPGLLKAFCGSNEVITTMMLNFIILGLANGWTLRFFRNPLSQNPESAIIQTDYFFKNEDILALIFQDSNVNNGILLAIFFCLALWLFLWKTPWGFELRAVGYNPQAAARAHISVRFYQVLAFGIAGLMASGVSYSEVIAGHGQYKIGFSPEYGFMGIAVALLAQNHPLKIIPAAFLFAVLQKGSGDLDLETQLITKDFSKVIQALIILAVVAQGLWTWKQKNNNRDSHG